MRFGKSNGWLDNQPAAITRQEGKGSLTYIGVWMNPEGMTAAAKWMLQSSGVTRDLPIVPKGVEAYRRTGASKNVLILENFSSAPQTVALSPEQTDVLSGGTVKSVTLPVYGVAVLSQ